MEKSANYHLRCLSDPVISQPQIEENGTIINRLGMLDFRRRQMSKSMGKRLGHLSWSPCSAAECGPARSEANCHGCVHKKRQQHQQHVVVVTNRTQYGSFPK